MSTVKIQKTPITNMHHITKLNQITQVSCSPIKKFPNTETYNNSDHSVLSYSDAYQTPNKKDPYLEYSDIGICLVGYLLNAVQMDQFNK